MALPSSSLLLAAESNLPGVRAPPGSAHLGPRKIAWRAARSGRAGSSWRGSPGSACKKQHIVPSVRGHGIGAGAREEEDRRTDPGRAALALWKGRNEGVRFHGKEAFPFPLSLSFFFLCL